MSATLSGSLPGGDQNGLAALAPALVNQPDQMHVAVITFVTSTLKTDVATGDVVPTIKIKQFEPFVGGSDVNELRRLLRRAYERRTGKVELPLELERELDSLANLPTGPEWGDQDENQQ
jgi:hypothetical protein